MAYQHGQYPYHMPHTQHDSMLCHPQIQCSGFHPHMTQPELYYNPYAHLSDYAEDVYGGMYHGELEDCNEVSTRPRLTKDQVDILEHEFQKNPKPNSMLKRNLAATTNLHPQRVAVSSDNLSSFPDTANTL